MQKITPFLWFNDNAEEAVNFYINTFKDGKITSISRYGEGMPMPAGTAMTVGFEIFGQKYTALNGDPMFKFTEAVSFVVHCKDQTEVDHYWNTLTADGGQEQACAWLKDKYGLSWQIVPDAMITMMSDKDGAKAQRVAMAMMKMKKIIIADLEAAYNG